MQGRDLGEVWVAFDVSVFDPFAALVQQSLPLYVNTTGLSPLVGPLLTLAAHPETPTGQGSMGATSSPAVAVGAAMAVLLVFLLVGVVWRRHVRGKRDVVKQLHTGWMVDNPACPKGHGSARWESSLPQRELVDGYGQRGLHPSDAALPGEYRRPQITLGRSMQRLCLRKHDHHQQPWHATRCEI